MKKANKINSPVLTTLEKIKKVLSELLGVDVEDIDNDDFLTDDLQIKPSDLSELLELLQEEGIDTTNLNFTEIETVGDLAEKLDDNLDI